jgi:hypothetical protein
VRQNKSMGKWKGKRAWEKSEVKKRAWEKWKGRRAWEKSEVKKRPWENGKEGEHGRKVR